MTTSKPPTRRGPPPRRHTLRQRFERSADLYLRECYERQTPARADEYARKLELTPQYLRRSATEVLGMTLRDFLRTRQLEYAARLLRTTTYSTALIAVMSAFGTRPTFYRAFKAAYGMTPGEYRNKVPF